MILDPAQGVQDILVPDSRFFISAPNIDTDSENPFLPYDPLYQTVTGLFKKVDNPSYQVLFLVGSLHIRNQLRWGRRHITLRPDRTLQGKVSVWLGYHMDTTFKGIWRRRNTWKPSFIFWSNFFYRRRLQKIRSSWCFFWTVTPNMTIWSRCWQLTRKQVWGRMIPGGEVDEIVLPGSGSLHGRQTARHEPFSASFMLGDILF